MKLANNITIKVFITEEEDENKIKTALLALIPFDLEKEKITLDQQLAEGYEYKKIKILMITLNKTKHTNEFLKHLVSKLSDDHKQRLLKQYDSRVDDDLNFFLRLDKDYLIDNKYEFTDTGNCFHIKINLASFPAKKENGKFVLERILHLS